MDEHEWKFIPRLIVLDSTDEEGFKKWIHFKEKKKKFGSLACFFLVSIYTCWNNVILRWIGKSGNNAFQVDWKVK